MRKILILIAFLAAAAMAAGQGGDYRLCTGVNTPAAPCAGASPYHNAGSDGLDIGANVAAVTALTNTAQ